MIRQLRRTHRAIIIALAIALIAVFIAALSVRPHPPVPNAVRFPATGGGR
jgi:hypothetical protein